jgi:hypothetical protein
MVDDTAKKQGVGRVSRYRDAVAPEGTALVYIPSLVAILINKEEKKGSPLTREEVLYFRDNAAVLVIPQSAVGLAEQRRGYRDIDPAGCWEEWLEVREKRAARG